MVALKLAINLHFPLKLTKNSHLSFPPSHFPSLPSRRGHQRRKWRHHCHAKIYIGDKFALSLAKNSHLSFPPSHFPSLPSRRGHLYETSKNSIKLIPKTIGNRKRDCAWGCAGVKKNWRKINCWAQIITRRSRYGFWWFALNNWFFFNFLTPAHPHAQSLFLFPIVFGNNICMARKPSKRTLPDTTKPGLQKYENAEVNATCLWRSTLRTLRGFCNSSRNFQFVTFSDAADNLICPPPPHPDGALSLRRETKCPDMLWSFWNSNIKSVFSKSSVFVVFDLPQRLTALHLS